MPSLTALINESQRIALIAHIEPDGDAVGSVAGLLGALEQLGKTVTGVLVDGVPSAFTFIKDASSIKTELPPLEDIDLCIILDAPDLSRSGRLDQMKAIAQAGKLATIDHHLRGDVLRLSQAAVHDLKASSTSELVYQVIKELGVHITPDIATALLTGIFTDTGGFQYANTTNETLDTAAELMRRGAKLQIITRNISRQKSLASLKLLGLALQRLRITCQGKCAVSVLTNQDITDAQASFEDITGIIGTINVLPGVELSILLIEIEPGLIRGTMRSGEGSKVNSSVLAKLLGGGGHPRASGFALPGKIVIDGPTWEIIAKPE